MSIQMITENDFKEIVLDSNIPVLVDFYAVWCGPCKMISPILEKLQKEYENKIKIVKIDIDSYHNLAETYKIHSIPNMILFKNGVEVDRIIGVVGIDKFKTIFDKFI